MHPRSGRSRRFVRTCGVGLAPLLTATVAACSAGTPQPEGASPTVVTSIYPVTWVAERVAGDAAQVRSLAESSADPHHLELTPRQIVEVKRAELVVRIRGLQPSLDEAVVQHARGRALDVTSAAHPGEGPGNGPGNGQGQGHGHGNQPGGGHRGAFDPHVWLDPVRFATVAEQLGDRLAETDPAHAETYRQRARETAGRLRDLDHTYSTALRRCDTRTLVTSHRAFGHLAQRYDLNQVSIAGLDPQVEPSPARLTEIVRAAEEQNVTTVFHDRSASAELATVVADELGARIATLDTVTDPPADDSSGYLAAMRANLETLRKALGCS